MLESPQARAFVTDVLAWLRHADGGRLPRILRSRFAGIPHDAAAAYATLEDRIGPIFEAIERGRLALCADEREAMLSFVDRMRKLRALSETLGDESLAESIAAAFQLDGARDISMRASPAVLSLNLCESEMPDERAGVRARQQHFSPSALNTYAECPRKWYYRYVCAAVEDAGSSASFYGTAFHLALEDFHAEFPAPYRSDERSMRERMRSCVTWAFERHRADFGTAIEVELQMRRAQRTAQRYVDFLIAESRRAPFTVFGRELPANLELGGFAFVGFIDRLDRDEQTGAVTVIDYKTGSIATSAQEYREKVRRFTDFQLPFYYWARTEAGDRVTRLALLPLKDALLDVAPIMLEVVPVPVSDARRSGSPTGTIGIEDLERARTRMIEICEQLTNGSLDEFPVAADPAACTYCAYATACALRPIAEREKFGR